MRKYKKYFILYLKGNRLKKTTSVSVKKEKGNKTIISLEEAKNNFKLLARWFEKELNKKDEDTTVKGRDPFFRDWVQKIASLRDSVVTMI